MQQLSVHARIPYLNFTPVYQMNFKNIYFQGIQYNLKSLLCVFCKGYML